jgi:hypothetical protein
VGWGIGWDREWLAGRSAAGRGGGMSGLMFVDDTSGLVCVVGRGGEVRIAVWGGGRRNPRG